MDDFTYDNLSPTTHNKLNYVDDDITTTGGSGYGDIQHGQTTGNYTYDAKGQLITDVQEGISEIKWYQSGKVKAIKRNTDGSEMRFFYDPMGNRIMKIEQDRTGGYLLTKKSGRLPIMLWMLRVIRWLLTTYRMNLW